MFFLNLTSLNNIEIAIPFVALANFLVIAELQIFISLLSDKILLNRFYQYAKISRSSKLFSVQQENNL